MLNSKDMNKNLVGILLIDKPVGITSTVVDRVCKRRFNLSKVGHLGTLDPFASGLIPVAFNGATKLIPYIKWNDNKTYEFEIEFGKKTDTGDITGSVIDVSGNIPTIDKLKTMLSKFIGEIQQRPHLYSAVKINGKPAYELMRKGIMPEIKTKTVAIHKLEYIEQTDTKTHKLKATVSGGTYIRSLAEDIASSLNTVAYTKSLRRTGVGLYDTGMPLDFISDNKNNIDEVVSNNEVWLSVENVLDDIPVIEVTDEEATNLRLGRSINLCGKDGLYLVKSSNGFVNLSRGVDGCLQPERLIKDVGV